MQEKQHPANDFLQAHAMLNAVESPVVTVLYALWCVLAAESAIAHERLLVPGYSIAAMNTYVPRCIIMFMLQAMQHRVDCIYTALRCYSTVK
jgi:hypothetical protein